jgi:hypothetical protein
MPGLKFQRSNLTDGDLDFIVEKASPESRDKEKLKQALRDDGDFRKALIGDEQVFQGVLVDAEIFLKISPALYFEILLRRTLKELQKASHTVEKVGGEQIPVFDTKTVVGLLTRDTVLEYLADMLASFTRTESYVIPLRVRKGVWRKIRFSDMDIDALRRMCEVMEERDRFNYYKRIADVCLFIPGMFPEYTYFNYRYPQSREIKPRIRISRRGIEDYEEEGRRFYKLAASHESARILDLSDVFRLLYENFSAARKPVSFISQNYIHQSKNTLFGLENQ